MSLEIKIMFRKIRILPLFIFLIIIFIFFYFLISQRDPKQIPSALINKKVPNFFSTTLINNQKISSNEIFNERTIVVNFFATWCAPCRLEHEYINQLSSDKNIRVIGINYKDEQQKTIKWLNELGNPYFKVLNDIDGSIGLEWGIYGLPETFIVSNDSNIVYKQIGPLTKKNFDEFYKKVQESYN